MYTFNLLESGTERDRASTLPSSDPDHACHSPKVNKDVFPNEGSCNTGGIGHCSKILFLKYSRVCFERLYGPLHRLLGFPEEFRLDVGNRIVQDNWKKRGLYISYRWLKRSRGFVDLLVVITRPETAERWERVIDLIPRSPSDVIQGVSS